VGLVNKRGGWRDELTGLSREGGPPVAGQLDRIWRATHLDSANIKLHHPAPTSTRKTLDHRIFGVDETQDFRSRRSKTTPPDDMLAIKILPGRLKVGRAEGWVTFLLMGRKRSPYLHRRGNGSSSDFDYHSWMEPSVLLARRGLLHPWRSNPITRFSPNVTVWYSPKLTKVYSDKRFLLLRRGAKAYTGYLELACSLFPWWLC